MTVTLLRRAAPGTVVAGDHRRGPTALRYPVMARPLWNGVISFGLLNIPVSLRPGVRTTDLQFRMLDSRDNARIRFERVNAETGEEVPWKQIVKAFEYEKGNYVVLDDKDFERAAPESHEAVEIESFVPADAISPVFFEKPYYLVPGKRADKGYVLLREVLQRTGRVAIARVVIRTREHLSVLMPLGAALVLLLIRFPQELVEPDAAALPDQPLATYRVTPREIAAAEQLVESMSVDFDPANYVDDFRARLHEAIERRIEADQTVTPPDDDDEPAAPKDNVVDLMALLKRSLKAGRTDTSDTPAKPARASRRATASPPASPPAPLPAKKARTSAAKRTSTAKRAPPGKRSTAAKRKAA